MVSEYRQQKNADYIVDNKVLITKLSFEGTFTIKNTVVDIIFLLAGILLSC